MACNVFWIHSKWTPLKLAVWFVVLYNTETLVIIFLQVSEERAEFNCSSEELFGLCVGKKLSDVFQYVDANKNDIAEAPFYQDWLSSIMDSLITHLTTDPPSSSES